MCQIDPASLVFDDGRPQIEIDKETGCWIWQGTKMRGYGRMRRGQRGSVQAHKVIYERIHGPVPGTLKLGHTCGRRSCVFPAHVRPITEEQNNKERYRFPQIGATTHRNIEETIICGESDLSISHAYGISCWAVRQIRRNIGQYQLEGL